MLDRAPLRDCAGHLDSSLGVCSGSRSTQGVLAQGQVTHRLRLFWHFDGVNYGRLRADSGHFCESTMMLIMQAAKKRVHLRSPVGHIFLPAIDALAPGLQSPVAVLRLVQARACDPRCLCEVFRGCLHMVGLAAASGGLHIGWCALAAISSCCG